MAQRRSLGAVPRLGLAAVAGLATAAAFPPFDLSLLAWIGLVPLFASVDDRPAMNAAAGAAAGLAFHAFLLCWLHRLAGPLYLGLAAYLAAYWALFCVLLGAMPRRRRVFAGAALWVLLEFLVSNVLTGFPWLPLGLSQHAVPRVLPLAGIAGVHGISAAVVLANLALAAGFRPGFRVSGAAAAILLAAVLANPAAALAVLSRTRDAGHIDVLVVQRNMASSRDRDPAEILASHAQATAGLLARRRADLAVWPESSYPAVLNESPAAMDSVRRLAARSGCPILLGAISSSNGRLYNTAFLVAPGSVGLYRKTHLAPYGEFIIGGRFAPVRRAYERIAGYVPALSRGSGHAPLAVGAARVGALICFENVFPRIARDTARAGAGVLVVITNDSWFGRSFGPHQHFAHNRLRAAETGRWVVQAALTGVSGVVAPDGTVEAVSGASGARIFVEGHMARRVPLRTGTTPYARFGDVPLFLLAVILLGVSLCRQ